MSNTSTAKQEALELHRETGIPIWAVEIAFELSTLGMLDEETMAGTRVIPDTARIIAARVHADLDGGEAWQSGAARSCLIYAEMIESQNDVSGQVENWSDFHKGQAYAARQLAVAFSDAAQSAVAGPTEDAGRPRCKWCGHAGMLTAEGICTHHDPANWNGATPATCLMADCNEPQSHFCIAHVVDVHLVNNDVKEAARAVQRMYRSTNESLGYQLEYEPSIEAIATLISAAPTPSTPQFFQPAPETEASRNDPEERLCVACRKPSWAHSCNRLPLGSPSTSDAYLCQTCGATVEAGDVDGHGTHIRKGKSVGGFECGPCVRSAPFTPEGVVEAAREAAREIVEMIEVEREPYPKWSKNARRKYQDKATDIIARHVGPRGIAAAISEAIARVESERDTAQAFVTRLTIEKHRLEQEGTVALAKRESDTWARAIEIARAAHAQYGNPEVIIDQLEAAARNQAEGVEMSAVTMTLDDNR